ncbi:MAG TPA: carboxypeptidase-like regulatory domain-containing protein [Pyrinomonadaceae bacterium]|nr:carboxypeptidase-like regulatory domain-containing protein [Pyrinomonadaceae bacterium]
MNSKLANITIIGLLALITAFGPVFALAANSDTADSSQIQFAAVTVNGRTLSGPNSSAQRLNGRILVPVAAIAQALGDVVTMSSASRSVSVRRSNGVVAELNARVGQVRENGSAILSVANASEINFPPNTYEFMLPIEIAASLFEVSIRYESDKNIVTITRGIPASSANQTKNARGIADIQQIDYEYNLNRYSSTAAHSLVLLGAGRLADGRFSFSSNASSSSRGISVQNATFNLQRPNGQHITAGDMGTGGTLQFMAANIRGLSVSTPVGDLTVTGFGGRTYSGVVLPFTNEFSGEYFGIRKLARYDTNIFGAFVTGRSDVFGQNSRKVTFSGGAMRFSSANRNGTFGTGNVSYESERIRLQSDIAYGIFDRLDNSTRRTAGAGTAVDFTGTFQLREDLAVQARYTNISRNFLSPQSGVREPLDMKAAGVTWSPAKWLSTSINASISRRPGDNTQNNKFVTAAFAITPSAAAPRFHFSHTQSSTSQIRSASFTTLNASKDFSRVRLYANATRIKNIGAALVNAQFGANFSVNDTNAIEISQGFGNRRSYNGQIDWRTSNLLKQRLSFSAGAGYSYSPASGFSPYQRLAASVKLPRQASLQVNYYNTNNGATVLVSLRGTLFRKREAQAFLDSPTSEINSFGKISGRVYQDVDQDGKFDPSVDKPQSDVKVRVDGNRYVVSDENGIYQFESITSGDHEVYLDLLSVRADLTLLSNAAERTKLRPGHTANQDFRLVRTGRISGRVWLDTNENGRFDEGEIPLADVRVVTGSGRDTLTDADGSFTIVDLPPGEHVFLLDEKTLPEKMVSAQKPLAVQAFAGRETSEINLAVINIPAEVKKFPAKQP